MAAGTLEDKEVIANYLGVTFKKRNAYWKTGKKVFPLCFWTTAQAKINYYEQIDFSKDWEHVMVLVLHISDELCYSINATLEHFNNVQQWDGLYKMEDIYKACVDHIKYFR